MGHTNSKNRINKNNTLLNIYVCNSDQQIKNIKFIEEISNDNLIKDIDYIEYRHKFYGWNFYDYGKEIDNNKVKDIRDKITSEAKNGNFQNVLIYFDKNSNNNDNALKIMRSIAEIPRLKGKHSKYYQPLLLYISYSKEKNTHYYRRKLHEIINISKDEYEMDELSITSLFYNKKTFNSELINELWQMTIYFNQIPSYILPMSQNDDKLEIKFDNNIFTLNFLLAGENGTGKSTFINILKGRKIAYESDLGYVKTNKINEYIISIHKEIPENDEEILDDSNDNIDNNIINNLNENNLIENNSELSTDNSIEQKIGNNKEISFCYQIIDTIGFSLDNIEADKLLKCIKEYNNESIKRKDRIQCILYFLNENAIHRNVTSNVIKDFFKFVVNQKIKVIFVINFNDGKRHDCKEKLTTALNQVLSEDEFNFLVEDDESNIIELNLRKNKEAEQFGLNKLMSKLEKMFENNRINIDELVKLNNEIETPMSKKNERKEERLNEYLKELRKSELFKDINTVNDLYVKFISKSKRLILYSMPILTGISFIPIPGVDDAIALSIESGLIAAIGNCFGINMTKKEIKKAFINVNFGSFKRISILVSKVVLRTGGIVMDVLKLAPPLGTIIAGAVSAGVNVASVKLTGEQAISYFLERFTKEIDYKYLINMCNNYNNNIDGFKYLKEYFNFAEED